MVCDAHTAKDVTQGVFIALAQQCPQLTDRAVLSGWLHCTSRNLAVKAVRAEVRRRTREQEAAVMNELLSNAPDASWDTIAPHLDAALSELDEPYRDAILLRYFERKSAREMAYLLGVSDEAAQKRVSRAVDRLREFFAKRGITVGAGGLVAIITANAVQAAPVGLAVTISTVAAAAGTTLAATATATVTKAIAMTTTNKLMTTALVVLLAGSALLLWLQNASLHRDLANLRASVLDGTPPPASTKAAAESGITEPEKRQQRREYLELLRLRGRVTQLANQLRERNGADPGTGVRPNPSGEAPEGDSILFSAALTNRVSTGSSLVLGGWSRDGMRGYLVLTPVIQTSGIAPESERLAVQSQLVGAPESFWAQIGWGDAKSEKRRSTVSGVLTHEATDTLLLALKETKGAELSNTSLAKGPDGEKMGFGWSMDDEQGDGTLMSVELYPKIAPDGRSVDLGIRPSPVSTNTPIHPSMKTAGEASPSQRQ